MEPDPADRLTDEELADLARLVDGKLPADRRAEVEARVAASPHLASIVERQGAVVEALGSTADTGAPARLRADVDRRRDRRRPARRPLRILGPAVGVATAAVVAVVIVLSGAVSGPSVGETVALASKPATQPAPPAVPATPQLLAAEVDDVPFPNYTAKFGWSSAGAREDDPDGRDATTVFYDKDRRRVAYTIVSGDELDPPPAARTTRRGGVEYRTFRADGRTAVTWERGGHTCVLSGVAVRAEELVELADWRGKGAIPF